jgi:hypothetical protein
MALAVSVRCLWCAREEGPLLFVIFVITGSRARDPPMQGSAMFTGVRNVSTLALSPFARESRRAFDGSFVFIF